MRNRCLVLSAATILSFASFQRAEATAETLTSSASAAEHFRLFPNVKELKSKPQSVTFFELDSQPLGSRRPLLLVHGMRGEFWRNNFRWRKLITYLNANSDFHNQYKIYLARYDSYAPLKPSSEQFKQAVKQLSTQAAGKPISVIALSIGGNIVADAMLDAQTDAYIDRVITLGTPFHGSPLFTFNWMEYTFLKASKNPLVRLDSCLPYKIYFGKHTNLLSDLNWDNSDANIPSVGDFHLWIPRARLTLSPSSANASVLAFNSNQKLNKSKFTVYGGYLETSQTLGLKPSILKNLAHKPTWFAKTVVPEHWGNEHAVLRVLNRDIADAAPAPSSGAAAGTVYGLNDGITPLLSSLFLPSEVMTKTSVTTPADVSKLRLLTNVGKARVFANVDHLTFIDEYRPRGASKSVQDMLSGDSQSKPMFAWILDDLLDKKPNALADDR